MKEWLQGRGGEELTSELSEPAKATVAQGGFGEVRLLLFFVLFLNLFLLNLETI